MPAPAQAEIVTDRGVSPLVSAAYTLHLESVAGAPMARVGTRRTVEAGVIWSQGTIFSVELGGRIALTTPRASYAGTYVRSAAGAFGGVRVDVLPEWEWPLHPVIRGGLALLHQTRRFQPGPFVTPPATLEDGITAGPHLSLGLEWALGGGASIGVGAVAHVLVAPFVVDVGVELSISGGRF